MVIITKPDSASGDSSGAADSAQAADAIDKTLALIGVPSVSPSVSTGTTPCGQAGQCSSFSAIGVPGLPAEQGSVNPGLAGIPGSGQPGGDLSGYFQPDLNATPGYVFVNTDRVQFDTGASSGSQAIVTIGSSDANSPIATQTYTSASSLSGPGFFVVVLDAGSLAPKGMPQTYADTGPGLTAMDKFLHPLTSDPSALVIVRSIGAVTRVSSGTGQVGPWDAVTGDLQALGGSWFYLNALDGGTNASQYAQVGPGGQSGVYPSPWTQIASFQHHAPTVNDPGLGTPDDARLVGLLARDRSGQFYPDESTAPDAPLTDTLPGIVSLPLMSWPDRSGADNQAALNCIAANVNPDGNNLINAMYPTIESHYTDSTLGWQSLAADLNGVEFVYPAVTNLPGCANINGTSYGQVKAELRKEFAAVGEVWQLVTTLKEPFIPLVAVTLEVQGQPTASPLTVGLHELDGVLEVSTTGPGGGSD